MKSEIELFWVNWPAETSSVACFEEAPKFNDGRELYRRTGFSNLKFRFEALKDRTRAEVDVQLESVFEPEGNEGVGDSMDKELETIALRYLAHTQARSHTHRHAKRGEGEMIELGASSTIQKSGFCVPFETFS